MTAQHKPKVVFVVNDFIIGGVQRLYLELFTHLEKRYELHLITCMELPGRVDLYGEVPPHVTIHRLSFTSLYDLRSLRALSALLTRITPDLVFTSLFFSNTVTRIAGLFGSYPIVAIEHNTNTWKTGPQIFVDRVLALRSRLLVATSASVKAFTKQQANIPEGKIRVIPNAIPLEAFAHVRPTAAHRNEFGFTTNEKIVINVARLTKQKNQPMLIEAFARFSSDHPDYRLLILGEGPERAALEALIRRLSMEGKIVLAGARQDVAPYLALAPFAVASSFIEGFGIAHAEALASGIPVLSTKTAGPDEMIHDGVNGYFMDTTIEGIYDGLVKMASKGISAGKDELRASVARFDSPAIAQAYSALANELLGISEKPRIALMTYAIDGRQAKGTALVARKCVEELLKVRDRYDLTFIHYEPSDDPIYQQGVREVLLPRLPGILNKRSLRQIWYFFTTKDRFDIMQWFQPRLYPFFWRAPARRLVVEVHGAGDVAKEAPFDLMRYVFNWTMKTFLRHIDRAIVASEFAKQDIVEKYGFAPAQVRVIYNGAAETFAPASLEEIARVRAKYTLPERFLMGVGRLNPNKNVFSTLRAYARYVAESGDDIRFVNIGAKGTEKAAIDAWLATCPVRDRISFVGFVEDEDFPAVYSAATVLVFPLLNEGFGLPLIEAMACGVPTIVSSTAYPDITRDQAHLVDATSEEAIAQGIAAVMSDASYREMLRTNGRARARSLTWANTGKGLVALYEELLR